MAEGRVYRAREGVRVAFWVVVVLLMVAPLFVLLSGLFEGETGFWRVVFLNVVSVGLTVILGRMAFAVLELRPDELEVESFGYRRVVRREDVEAYFAKGKTTAVFELRVRGQAAKFIDFQLFQEGEKLRKDIYEWIEGVPLNPRPGQFALGRSDAWGLFLWAGAVLAVSFLAWGLMTTGVLFVTGLILVLFLMTWHQSEVYISGGRVYLGGRVSYELSKVRDCYYSDDFESVPGLRVLAGFDTFVIPKHLPHYYELARQIQEALEENKKRPDFRDINRKVWS